MNEIDRVIKRLIGKGYSYVKIASILGIGSDSVAIRAKSMGLGATARIVNSYADAIKRGNAELVADYHTDESPLIRAKQLVFGERVQEKNGCFYLDGVPTNYGNIIIEANKRLKAWDMKQIDNNTAWRVN